MKNKILLISPAYDKYDNEVFNEKSRIPVGIILLQDIFRTNGIHCDLLDLNRSKRMMNNAGTYEKLIKDIGIVDNYEYIGLSSISNNFINAILIAKQIKKMFPEKIVFLGGPHVSIVYSQVLKTYNFIDFIVVGEGEHFAYTFSEYLKGERPIDKVSNLVMQNSSLSNYRVQNISELLDANSIPPLNPDFEILNSNYDNVNSISIEGGRGCPFNCIFCSTSNFWKRKPRMKPVNAIITEMKNLNKNKGVTRFKIVHDLFTNNKQYIEHFMDEASKHGFIWNCSARIDTVDFKLLEKMYESGCKNIFFGVETVNQEFQRLINKNLDLSKLDPLVEFCVDHNYEITLSFIFGFPFDDEISISKNIQAIIKYNSFSNVNISDGILTPEPGTEIYNKYYKDIQFDKNYLGINYDYVPIEKEIEYEHIEKYPELYSHFYYINNSNFTIYSIDLLEKITRYLSTNYSYTVLMILEECSKLIVPYLESILQCDFKTMDLEDEKKVMSLFSSSFENSISSMSESVIEMYRFEKKLFEAKKKAVKSQSKISFTINSKVNIQTLGNFRLMPEIMDNRKPIIIQAEPAMKKRVKVNAFFETN